MAKHQVLRKFYQSKEWTMLRMILINERGNRCQDCGKIVGKSSELIGHHMVELTPENVQDHSISLNPDLIELLCFDCHNKEHRRFGYQQTSRQVFLVYGPPLSGKTTYVRQNMERGDLIVDVNELSEAISLLPSYDRPDTLLTIVLGLRNQLYDNIRTRFGKWRNAWIVGGYADRYQRNRLIEQLGAEPVFCDVSRDECLSRLELEESLMHRKAEWAGYIDRWFDQYTE